MSLHVIEALQRTGFSYYCIICLQCIIKCTLRIHVKAAVVVGKFCNTLRFMLAFKFVFLH